MLALSRKVGEAILLDGGIKIVVSRVDGGKVRLAIDAPKDVRILRQEVVRGACVQCGKLQSNSEAFTVIDGECHCFDCLVEGYTAEEIASGRLKAGESATDAAQEFHF